MHEERRGILYPGRLPEFHRIPAPPGLAHAVRWFWIPVWDLPDGEESRQTVLPFPACNLVVEPGGITAVGPPTRCSERILVGRGWAVGALLRPAAVPPLIPCPAELRDTAASIDDRALHAAVAGAMDDPSAPSPARRESAVAALGAWIQSRVPSPEDGSDAALANRLADLLADPTVLRVDQLAERAHLSVRSAQRLAERFFGLSPHAMIRRRRLQEAAERLREDPRATIAALAAELGYSDHPHFTTDFKAVLGVTPSAYRALASPGSAG
ncbi:helix-turn-helix transcriptional regulator [Leucobacter sp. CSA1]|uniref:Helix-turn-helix transcriptional regulator n=1 Tax=Leucobacter chromiisoli TaxID=2796471 RepID=A0A934Q964_9MICO|nr:helix-turn-helix domain-containing protein [Leucobacter chromiisoli]MBK0419431.1 helix-turn-helix transcriptional regulator [Leucobacter chromiisoli]